jgi:NADH-quinone oxidoreductase subunit A
LEFTGGITATVLDQYIGVLLTFVVGTVIVGVMVSASALLAGSRHTPVKDEVFECGNPSSGNARGRFSVHFYLVAILFIVFDVEVVFLYPWAIVFRELGVPGLVAMGIFISILAIGLAYEWKRGTLAWE